MINLNNIIQKDNNRTKSCNSHHNNHRSLVVGLVAQTQVVVGGNSLVEVVEDLADNNPAEVVMVGLADSILGT